MSDRHVSLFPDTNALLHYPQIRDVDWCAVAGANAVTIVLCLQVVRELDAKKSDARLRTRAERAIHEIRELMSRGGAVRKGVTLEVFNEELRSTDFDESLSPDSGDDRIVRFVKKYSEKTGTSDVAVYSEDLGMSIRCSAHGISVIEPAKASRLEDPHSELEKKYKAAMLENQSLKNQLPDIRVVVRAMGSESDGPVAEFELSRSVTDILDVEAEVERERRRLSLPPQLDSPASDPSKSRGVRLSDLAGLHQPLTEEQRRQYDEALDAYLKQYAVWVATDHAARSALERMIDFEVEVSNQGKAVGEEVDVYLEFPAVFQYLSGESETMGQFPVRPQRPELPKRPGGRTTNSLWDLLSSGGVGPAFRPFTTREPYDFTIPKIHNSRDPWCKMTDNAEQGLTLRIFIPRLNHHHHRVFGPFVGVLKSWEVARPFEVKVDIMSASHPDKCLSRGAFKISVVRKEEANA